MGIATWSCVLHTRVVGLMFNPSLCCDEAESFQEPFMCDTSYGGVRCPRRANV